MRWVVIPCLLFASCSSQGGVAATLDEWSLRAQPSTSVAGDVTFRVRNDGSVAHEFLVLRTSRAFDRLPEEAGAAEVDTEGVEMMGEIGRIAPAGAGSLTLTLRAGSYALICNIAGHYSNGMRSPFRVRAA